MMRRWVPWGASLLILLLISGCSVSGPLERSPASLESGPSTSPAGNPPSTTPSTTPVANLAEQLEKGALPAVTATYRWKMPASGLDYEPLLPGLLLTYTRFVPRGESLPFEMHVIDASGKELWKKTWPFTNQDVEYLDVSADGERIAIIEGGGKVTVVDSRTGSVLATPQFTPDAWSIGFIDRGRLLAVERETPSAIYRRVVEVYALAGGGDKPLYGAEGTEVFASPHHGMLLAVVPEGVEVVTPTGSLGVVAGALPQRGVRLHISGDGRWVFVWGSEAQALHIYDAHLRPVGAPIGAEYGELSFPAFASLYYKGQTAFFMDGTSRKLEFDQSRWRIGQVLPGGEVELVPTGKEKMQCIVTTKGDLFGCFPWVLWGRNTEGTLLWYSDQNWINVYRL